MRLWDAGGTPIDEAILRFTVGDDPELDRQLVPYDCLASMAHAEMLSHIGELSGEELAALREGLREALTLAREGRFEILPEQEDGHTALEAFLTERAGDAGRRVHAGRSRNDQVIAALRLHARERLLAVADAVLTLASALLARAEEHRLTWMPGYTHTRQAMPSTMGHLFAATAEGLIRDLELLDAPLRHASRGALGSASGYGVPLPLDRERVARSLALSAPDVNSIHVQNSRGRLESQALSALHQISLTLARAASDWIAFSSEALGFLRLPAALTTGSSIMPQKRNPDVLELVRTLPATLLGRHAEVGGMLHGLGAGYHRDLQRTKGPYLRGIDDTLAALSVMRLAAEGVQVDVTACREAMRPELFATDRAYALVAEGLPFREAYRQVKERPNEPFDLDQVAEGRTHLGAPGRDDLPLLRALMDEARDRLAPCAEAARRAWEIL